MNKLARIAAALALAGAVTTSAQAETLVAPGPLTGRVWVETSPSSGLPGVMLVFLPNGTLLMDSCWETYALRNWTRTAPDAIAWDEDGAKVTAKVQSVSASQLTLKIKAGRDVVEHRYTSATVPYVCPDMKR